MSHFESPGNVSKIQDSLEIIHGCSIRNQTARSRVGSTECRAASSAPWPWCSVTVGEGSHQRRGCAQFHAACCCTALFLFDISQAWFPTFLSVLRATSSLSDFLSYISRSWFLLLAIKNVNWYGKPADTLLLGGWPQRNYYSLFINPIWHEIRQKHFLLFMALRSTLLHMLNLRNRVPPFSLGGGRLLLQRRDCLTVQEGHLEFIENLP